MRHVLRALGFWLLLLVAQQGAVDHELSHVSRASHASLQVDSHAVGDALCAQCPAFAQVVTPAFSHAFHIPSLERIAAERTPEPRFAAIDAASPRPRSRGPPSSS